MTPGTIPSFGAAMTKLSTNTLKHQDRNRLTFALSGSR
jgi:hypothetical protein